MVTTTVKCQKFTDYRSRSAPLPQREESIALSSGETKHPLLQANMCTEVAAPSSTPHAVSRLAATTIART